MVRCSVADAINRRSQRFGGLAEHAGSAQITVRAIPKSRETVAWPPQAPVLGRLMGPPGLRSLSGKCPIEALDDRTNGRFSVGRELPTCWSTGDFEDGYMLQALGQMPYRRTVLAVFVLFVLGTSALEIFLEFSDGEAFGSMAYDLIRFVVSAAVLALFVGEHIAHQQALRNLREQLQRGRGRLVQLDNQSQKLGSQYRAVLQRQFDAWKLTASEQDVVIMMLKGLSFREIAELRETREKTVRQQASSVYRKSGVTSRNELAAWFFEDLLEPPPTMDR